MRISDWSSDVCSSDLKVNWKIRNHDNGFIYARDEKLAEVPKKVLSDSIKAVGVCGLDFGAVDVIYNEAKGIGFVLEINTAPGLTGTTLEGYTKRFKELEESFNNRAKQWDAGIPHDWLDAAVIAHAGVYADRK